MDWLKNGTSVAVTLMGAVLAEEFKQWSPRLAEWLVSRASRRLMPEDRDRYSEEWLAHLADAPGNVGKLAAALGFGFASRHIRRQQAATCSKAKQENVESTHIPSCGLPERARILVVDDEPVIANTLALILNQVGFEAQAVYSGEQAVQIAPDFRPQQIISDVVMVGMTGVDACIKIRSIVPECQVMLFGGQAATRDLIARAAKSGHHFSTIDKPFHPSELLSSLKGREQAR